MKLSGKENIGENIQLVIIPRSETENAVFRLRSVRNTDDFDKLCPEPEAPWRQKPGGAKIPNLDDPKYKKEIEQHGTKRFNWMMLESLKATEDLEWSTITSADSDSWENWREELSEFGLNLAEINYLVQAMMRANSIDEEYLKEARKNFLAGKAEDLAS